MATEIVGLKEFLFRRKIGRTTLFEMIKSEELIEDIDFIRDGRSLNFFWPARVITERNQRLKDLNDFENAEPLNTTTKPRAKMTIPESPTYAFQREKREKGQCRFVVSQACKDLL